MRSTSSEDWESITPARVEELADASTPEIGYLVWTKKHHGEKGVGEHIAALRARGIRHLRTGLSWAEWVTPDGRSWITWYMREYAKHFDVLPCLTFTPPHLGMALPGKQPGVNSPPKDVSLYGEFACDVVSALGDCFEIAEIGNEWNLETDWLPELDPVYGIFTSMAYIGGKKLRACGKRSVLGGMSKVNAQTLGHLKQFVVRGLPEVIDFVGFHNLRGTWSDAVPSPPLKEQSGYLKEIWGGEPWLTEYGFPVADPENRFDMELLERIQIALFAYAVYACITHAVKRVYWYTYKDEKHESLRFSTTGWEDVLQFHYGDTREDGSVRPLGKLLLEGGPRRVLRYAAEEKLFHLVDKASLGRKLAA